MREKLRGLGQKVRLDWGYFLVLILTVPAVLPLLQPGYFASHDGLHHLYRLYDLDWAMRSGVLYPRWLPNLCFGYGYPVLNYYAPLSYYVAEAFHLLGAGYIASMELTFALGFFLSGITMYIFARGFLGRWPAVVAATTYIYLPYHLADGYVRGALAEFFAFVFFPLILWAFRRLMISEKRLYIPLAALAYAGLILTHNLTALLFTPLLFAYLGFLLFRRRGGRVWGYCLLAILLALGLTAFYWLPGFRESAWVRLGQVGPTATDYRHQLVPLSQFFSPFLIYRYFPHQGVELEHPLSYIQLGLVSLSLLVVLRLQGPPRNHLLFFQVITILSLFMMLSFSAFLWEGLPLLPYLQFPWRFLSLVSVGSAILTGSLLLLPLKRGEMAIDEAGSSPWTYLMGLTIVGVLMVCSLPNMPIQPMAIPNDSLPLTEEKVNLATMAQYDYLNGLWFRLWGGTWGFEYLPRWVAEAREEFFLPLDKPSLPTPSLSSADIPNVTLGRQSPLDKVLRVETEKGMRLAFHTFYFPHWRIYVDGEAKEAYPSGRLGLLTVDLPPGDHQVLVRFEDTLSGRIGGIVSSLSILAVLAILILALKQRAILVGLAVLLFLSLLIPLRSWSSVEHPQERQVNLANRVRLLGYSLDKEAYHPGDTLNLTLYWLGLSEMDHNYKVFVHLTDEQEQLIGQSDQEPVFNFSPTTRWERGEIVADRYQIHIPVEAVPGTYNLFTGMYLLETMRNLDILDSDMNPQGNRVSLAEVKIVGD